MQNPLAAYLKEHKLTQRQFADRIGVRRIATISEWCNGALPKSKHIKSIAEATENAVPVTAWFADCPQNKSGR